MTSAQTDELILAFARLIGARRILVIGSQAVHYFIPNPPIEVVAGSREVDLMPLPYSSFEKWYYYAHEHLGADSEFDSEHGVYVDMVKGDVPRLPMGWESRAHERFLPLSETGDTVTAVFPDLHDLVVTKLFANRAQDIRFLQGIRMLLEVDAATVRERIASVPLPNEMEALRDAAYVAADEVGWRHT